MVRVVKNLDGAFGNEINLGYTIGELSNTFHF